MGPRGQNPSKRASQDTDATTRANLWLAIIPHDLDVLRALSNMEPSTNYNPDSEGSEEIMKLAASLMGEKYRKNSFRSLFSNLFPTRQDINREIFYKKVFR